MLLDPCDFFLVFPFLRSFDFPLVKKGGLIFFVLSETAYFADGLVLMARRLGRILVPRRLICFICTLTLTLRTTRDTSGLVKNLKNGHF